MFTPDLRPWRRRYFAHPGLKPSLVEPSGRRFRPAHSGPLVRARPAAFAAIPTIAGQSLRGLERR
jgi:hypothetical protein